MDLIINIDVMLAKHASRTDTKRRCDRVELAVT